MRGDQLLDHGLLLLRQKHCKLVESLLLRVRLRLHDLGFGDEMSQELWVVTLRLLDGLLILELGLHEASRYLRHLLLLLLKLDFLSLIESHVFLLFDELLKWL